LSKSMSRSIARTKPTKQTRPQVQA
jgi:hypothetical protein